MSGIDLLAEERDLRRIVQAVRQMKEGRTNTVGRVTLRTGQTTTTVTANSEATRAAANCSINSEVPLMPRTAHAAAILAQTYISSTGQGTFTITHPSSAEVDLTFGFEIRG